MFFKIIIISIVIISLIPIIKSASPSFIPLIYLSVGLTIIWCVLPYIYDLIEIINKISYIEAFSPYLKLTSKIIITALCFDFAWRLCADNNENYIASKIIFVGKFVILSNIIPVFVEFVNNIVGMLN